MIKYLQMKFAAFILLALFSFSALAAARVVVPSLPASEYADMEAATNAVVCYTSAGDNRFRLFLELDAETNNCVLVEFGVDADSSGALERGEVEFSVGWDCGEWGWRDHRGGCAAAVGRSAGRRRLGWTLCLRPDKTARRLFAEDDGVVFDGAVPSTFYSSEWNIARVVRRGPEPSPCVSYDMSVFPLTIKLR